MNLVYKVCSKDEWDQAIINQFYSDYLSDPKSLPKGWKIFFDGLSEDEKLILDDLNGPSWSPEKKIKKINLSQNNIKEKNKNSIDVNSDSIKQASQDSVRAIMLIRAYRIRGHLIAKLDPLGMMERKYLEDLHPSDHGFKKEDYNKKIYVGAYMKGGFSSINEILTFFRKIYCSTIGVEYMHISDPAEKNGLEKEWKNKKII